MAEIHQSEVLLLQLAVAAVVAVDQQTQQVFLVAQAAVVALTDQTEVALAHLVKVTLVAQALKQQEITAAVAVALALLALTPFTTLLVELAASASNG
jgi:hypothetical protein